MSAPYTRVDPFDLPEELGVCEVVWSPTAGLDAGHRVVGELRVADGDAHPCDLLAVDQACPRPAVDDALRTAVHQAWRIGQIELLEDPDGRLVLASPGTGFDADTVLELIARFARALGASPARYAVHLRLSD